MKERLTKFMQREGLTAAKLAEVTNVQPSTISHILAGRNNPRYEFLAAIAKKFPKLNSRWLLLGEGAMYEKDGGKQAPQPSASEERQAPELEFMPQPAAVKPTQPFAPEPAVKPHQQPFAPEPAAVQTSVQEQAAPQPEAMQTPIPVAYKDDAQHGNMHNDNELARENKPKLRAAKIVIFNSDGSFEIYQN